MGRVSTCQKNCNTIDLRRAQVNKHQSSIIITINNYDNSSSSNNNNYNNNNNKTSTASFTTATIKLVLFMVQKHHIDSGRFGHLVSPPGTSNAPAAGPGHAWHQFHREVAPASIPGPRRLAEHRWPFATLSFMGKSSTICNCPACRTTLVATRFRVAVICPIIQVPHCIRVFFYFVWFVFINHIFQFYYELCTYCNILDIYLS